MNPLLEARDTPETGKGMFAKQEVPKGTLLLVFGGYVLTRDEEEALPEAIRDIAIQIERDHVIGVIDENQVTDSDYVNHSCTPNSGIKGQLSLTSMKDINAGEQVLFDYGTVLYRKEGAPLYELACLCNASNCRGKITQDDWKLPELQERYKGFFPYYIQEEIDASHI